MMEPESVASDLDELEKTGIPRGTRGTLWVAGILGAIASAVFTVVVGLSHFTDGEDRGIDLGLSEIFAIAYGVSVVLCGLFFVRSSSRAVGVYVIGAFAMWLTAWWQIHVLESGWAGNYTLVIVAAAPLVSGLGAVHLASRWSSLSELRENVLDNDEGRPALARSSVVVVLAGIIALFFWPGAAPVRALIAVMASLASLALAAASLPNRTAGLAALLSMFVIFHLYRMVLW